MAFKKGDRVKFLNDTGGGVITGIIDNKTATVLIEDGFEVPVLLKELLPDGESSVEDTGNTGFTGIVVEEKEEEGVPDTETDFDSEDVSAIDSIPPQDKECNLFAAIVKSPENSAEKDLYLINDSNYRLLYTILLRDEGGYLNSGTGMLEEETKIFIRSFTRDELNERPVLKFQGIFYMKGIYEPKSPVQREIELDPAEVSGSGNYTTNDFFEQDAYLLPVYIEALEKVGSGLSEEEINALTALKEKYDPPGTERSKTKKKKKAGEPEEIDLHIEELVDDHRGMSNAEILETQMARFTTALEGALRSGTGKIVFIHGVGNGRLKLRIRQTLDRKYPRLRYQDASFKEYGYGATMVITGK